MERRAHCENKGKAWWCALALPAMVVLAPTAAGCAAVAPYERGKLACRVMRAAPDPAEAKLDAHVQEYREGSIGGTGVRGGGCGCN